jgi:hypothetical protein
MDVFSYYIMYARDGANGECTIDITDNGFLTPAGMVYDEIPRGDGSGMRQVALYLEADSNIIISSTIYYFKPEEKTGTLNPDYLPCIDFCVRLMVSNDDDDRLVNWLDIEFSFFFFFFLQLNNIGF